MPYLSSAHCYLWGDTSGTSISIATFINYKLSLGTSPIFYAQQLPSARLSRVLLPVSLGHTARCFHARPSHAFIRLPCLLLKASLILYVHRMEGPKHTVPKDCRLVPKRGFLYAQIPLGFVNVSSRGICFWCWIWEIPCQVPNSSCAPWHVEGNPFLVERGTHCKSLLFLPSGSNRGGVNQPRVNGTSGSKEEKGISSSRKRPRHKQRTDHKH